MYGGMKKVLLIGNGAREHVVAETLMRSRQQVEIYAYLGAKNPGIIKLAKEYTVGELGDLTAICEFAQKVKPDFAFIGPENPIGAGVVDTLLEYGIKSVAPLKTVARLESSKSFTRDLVEKYGIPGNPRFKVFLSEDLDTEKKMRSFLNQLGENYVVKADGLEGGKGVKVSGDHLNNHDEAIDFALKSLRKHDHVVLEEKLIGVEFSLMSFVDGETVLDMPAVQDHKRAFDGDKGPNTGGMGTYSDSNHSLPFLTENDLKQAHEISVMTTAALFRETGAKFKGIMFGGFMATASGIKLIEFNARFGDPEAMNVLSILRTDFVEICEAIINGNLNEITLEFENKATVCKYVVPEGYPDNPKKGEKIEIGMIPNDVKIYYAAVDKREDGLYMSGSRAIAFLGIADTLAAASAATTKALSSVKGPVFFRSDIGSDSLINERVDLMKRLRS